ncbi:MAG: Ig-like domain-containing protein [Candidatus Buchananbacteria bacterium]|nr:Ig-like domain-containing protein [Candidatus Buchananbacteria bacterium]
MSERWLNLFLKLSGFIFNTKQKVVKADNWVMVIPHVLVIIVFELGFAIISLPMYLIVSPKAVQERGFIFPMGEGEKSDKKDVIRVYTARRRISLTTGAGAGTFFVLKILLIVFTSLYLLGAQKLLAATQDWTFDTAGDYTYDSAKIEVTGGVGRLKNIGSATSGSTTNSAFTSDATDWTYADWLNNAGASGAYSSTGGNTGGNVQITLSSAKNKTTAGLYRQSFTTTVDSPDTATLNLDWSSISYSVPAPFDTYQLYAFIDTASGDPTLGQQVWSSGEITGTTAWASSATIDITSKVPTADTYYLKIVAYHDTPGTTGTYTTVAGFDNVVVNWSKTTVLYASDRPTINPTTSLSNEFVTTWDSFTETATKNGGEIYYQLSNDDGATWQYWNGSAWATAGASNYNTGSVINTNISTFGVTNHKIRWKAYLESNGSQQVILDNVNIGYTENDPTHVQNLSPAQNTTSGLMHVNYELKDDQSDPASLVVYEYSLTGAFSGEQTTMTASTTDASHNGVSGLSSSPTGVAHTFVWDAQTQIGAIYDASVYVRLRGSDGINVGDHTTSTAFAVDYVVPVVTNVSASQVSGSTNVTITYDLADDTSDNLLVELGISNDGGSTWVVPTVTASGHVGSGVTAGTGKSITWNAGTDYDEHQQSTMQVRVRAKDKYQNQGSYASSANFTLDTLNPVTNATSNLQAQPNAGDTTVSISGSFTEANPNTNDFYAALNGGAYSSATAGASDTVTPGTQSTAVGVTLDGNDYISGVKITHTDDFGQATDNENTSPNTAYKYVKPYTPQAPTLDNPVTTRLDLTINPHASETSGLDYLIQETTSGNYVQADGTLGASEVWQVMGTGSGQWGNNTSVSGKVRITGLSSPVANYIFKVKSRNNSDTAHAASSESAFSSTAQITNTAPSIALGSVAQTTDGTRYVPVNYTGTDGQGDLNDITVYEYSTDNSAWNTMTEKSGVGSEGLADLVFLSGGSAHNFVWDSGTDLPSVEDDTVYVRLRSTDTLTNSALSASSAFVIDNVNPVVSSVTASQDASARTVTIGYTLTDHNNSTVELDISEDGGSTWTVTDSSVTGDVGAGITPGAGKSITWNAGTDFDDQYQTDLQVRIRATDTKGNVSDWAQSANFTLDTKDPVVSSVTASQDSGAKTFVFHYDVSEDLGNVTVVLAISSNSGSTYVVPITSASGDTGAGITSGTGKTITWDAGADYDGFEETDMKIKITATDQFTNSSNNTSADFSLDSLAPRVTSVSATQNSGATTVAITYTLADQNNSNIEIDISEDGGSTWAVTDTSVTGDVGAGVGAGSKTITWNAGADFDEQQQSDIRVRVRGTDIYANASANMSSSNFSLDTKNPAVNVAVDLLAQPNAGDSTVLIGGSFTEANPNTNNFYVAINGTFYGSATAGTSNTASPSNQATDVGTTLDGSDYISQVKITHTDDFGQTVDNEDTSPNSAYVYVKPYTPQVPTVNNPTVGTVDVLINPHASEVSGLQYAIYETSQGKYVQADGTLGASAVWQIMGTASGQWGNNTSVSGKVRVNGLTVDSYLYAFQVKSRNSSDDLHATASESAFSSSASSVNQSPSISITSVSQTTDGTKYVTINYTGTDLEGEASSLISYQYSTNNSTWFTMTEKAGVGSDGTSALTFSSSGTTHDFMWDVGADLDNTEDTTVYVRLRANDGTSSGNIETSSAFTVDTKNPVISSATGTQVASSNNVTLGYTLTDLSSANIEIDISEDGGSNWTVTDTSVTGDIGSGITPGSGKAITWNAGADFDGQEQSDIRFRARGTDTYGNQGSYASSANFSLDTKDPAVSNVSASQNSGASTIAITYDLSDANNSTVEIDISSDGGSTWTVGDSSVTGDVGAGVTPGAGQTITWDAGTDFSSQDQTDIRVRVRATDIYSNASSNVESANFSLDTLGPSISSVTASQTSGGDNVVINYNLTDNSAVNVAIDISEDGGSTWTVTDTSVTGDVGAGVSQGSGKAITWNAGADFDNQDQSDLRVRVRGTDAYTNSSGNIESANFSLDTKDPATNSTANLISQPNAGDTTVSVGGSFTETSPNTNDFYMALNGGAYGASTAGTSNSASPTNQATAAGATLDGNDYVSKVKITHTDDFGHIFDNENTSPNTSYKYVKPYTPPTPTVNNPQNTSADVTIDKNASETSGLEYAIYENSTGQYVQANGTLGASAVWRQIGTGAGEWGVSSGVSGKITVSGLTSPVAQYNFQVKSRNTSDTLNASSSESSLSASASITNTSPVVAISSVAQQTGGVNYVSIDYTGTDAQNDTNDLNIFEYSTDNSTWSSMTEKAGVGSDGTSDLIFTSAGASFNFAWDSAADLPNTEDSTVYIRLRSTDSLANSNLAASSAFDIDNLGPIISNVSVSQTPSTGNIVINYDLNDNTTANNAITIDISEDGGSTWTVTDTSVTGSVGASISAGSGKSITWNAGADFDNEEQSDMKVRIRGTDSYGNVGSYQPSSDFSLDTNNPVVSAVSASQGVGSSDVTINYTLTDGTSAGHLVEIGLSSDGGVNWNVATSSVSGHVGSGQTTGSKSFTWEAGTDFSSEEQSDMRVRIRSTDYYGNVSSYASSANFSLDTASPTISNLAASQTAGGSNVAIDYDLADTSASNLTLEIDISDNGGSTWTVTDTSSTGNIGASQTTGLNKAITWAAGTDLTNQEQNDIRVRLRATDTYGNISSYFESSDFAVDTAGPIGLSALSKFSSTDTTITLNWSSAVTDANFDHYEIWHGSNASDVDGRSGTAANWDQTDDANLTNINTISTVVTGLNVTGNYYMKIWAVDDYGNEVTIAAINVFEAPATPEATVTPTGGGAPAEILTPDLVPPASPILSSVNSPTNSTNISISGLAEPRSVVDLYDNNQLIGRLISLTSGNGQFEQNFAFTEGSHVLTARATDAAGNASALSDQLILIIDQTPPAAPIVLVPDNNSEVSDATPQIIGVSEPLAAITVLIDNTTSLTTLADNNGAWNLILPSASALTDGSHSFAITATDSAGNLGPSTALAVTKIFSPVTVEEITPPVAPSIPLPSGAGITEIIESTELPGIQVPEVVQTAAVATENNILAFSGKSLPNKDVVVYIHSAQALIYQTRTDKNGNWTINHSQDIIELTPGQHSIFAVTVDPVAKVKSFPSEVKLFEVKRNFFALLFNLLNIQTTALVLGITLVVIFWLYRIRKKNLALAEA